MSGPPDVGCHGHGSDLLKNVPSVPIVVQFGGKEVQIEMDSSIWREDQHQHIILSWQAAGNTRTHHTRQPLKPSPAAGSPPPSTSFTFALDIINA